MDIEEVIKWLKIMKANLNTFPEINCGKKIKALAEAIRLLKNEQTENPTVLTTKNDLGVDWDELKRRILMEVDGGTDDKYLRYCDVCDRISNTIDEFVSDMRGEEE